MQLFYYPQLDSDSKFVTFDKSESGHIIKVLRMKEGDMLHITNGKGLLFEAVLEDTNPNKCTAVIQSFTRQEKSDYHVHIAVAPTKSNERFEWFLEKATEIGLNQITPVICEHSERKTIKTQRFERILESAMKQSLHYYLPVLEEAVSFIDFIQKEIPGQKFIAHCAKGEKILLKDAIKPNVPATVLIGPEGDFSPTEIDAALKAGYQPVSLGSSRLRTETAALVACHSVVLMNEGK